MKTNKKNIFWGVILIALGLYVILNKTGLLVFNISVVSLILSVVFIGLAIKSIIGLDFFGFLVPISLVYWVNEDLIHKYAVATKNISGWTVLLAAVLLGIGLNLIFVPKKKRKHVEFNYGVEGDNVQSNENGRIKIETSFNSTTKYINTENFRSAEIDNAFGQLVVYFDNAVIAGGEAHIDVDNAFGNTNIYIPRTWRLKLNQDSAFGNIEVVGQGNADADAPCVYIDADNSFGKISIIFS